MSPFGAKSVLESEGRKMKRLDFDDEQFDDGVSSGVSSDGTDDLDGGADGDIAREISNDVYLEQTNISPNLPQEVTDDVVRFYSPMVYRIALTKTRSTHDADDIFQEVFLKLVSHTKPFECEEHRKAWLIRVTVNCCNSHFVAPWRKNVDCMDDYTLSQIPDEDNAIERSEDTDVYAQILRLPQSMREVIILFYYENMPIKEIAQTLGESEANIKKRLSRARQKLKLELE